MIGKEEYAPFAAEMHYFRVAKRYWSICFERIRKAGFRIISTVVPWNLHETRQGEFDFSGRTDPTTDLVVFLELAREFGFKIILKPGPWIQAQWKNGGIPDFVFRHPETAAKDRNGEPLAAESEAGISGGLVPSYLQTRFQILLRHFYSVFCDVVKNYIYPRGPVFLIEIDYEPSFCHNLGPYSGDYNEYVVRSLYPKFLAARYETTVNLNKAYKTKHKDFAEVIPPIEYDAKTPHECVRHLDWVAFREQLVNRYVDSVSGLFSSAEMLAMFSRANAWSGNYHFPDLADATRTKRTIFTTNLSLDLPLSQAMDRVRTISATQDLGFIANFPVGHASSQPEIGEEFRPVTEEETKRLLVAALAGGAKGMNFSMFVGQEHWYGAALSTNGTVGPSYDIIRHLNYQLARINFETMTHTASLAIVRYRPYLRGLSLGRSGPFGYLADLLGEDSDQVGQELLRCGFDYRIVDFSVPESLNGYQTLVVPVAEFMSAEAQTTLLELLRQGVGMVFYGNMPHLNEWMQPCEILARALGVSTSAETKISHLETGSGQFMTRTYAHIRKMPSRAKRLAKTATKTYAIAGRFGTAPWHLLTFNPAPAGDPGKGLFFKSLWDDYGLVPSATSSDQAVIVILQHNAKNGILYVMDNSTPQSWKSPADDAADQTRPVVIRADLSTVGIKAKRVTLTDIFSEKSIKTTTQALRNGHLIYLKPGESLMFYIERG